MSRSKLLSELDASTFGVTVVGATVDGAKNEEELIGNLKSVLSASVPISNASTTSRPVTTLDPAPFIKKSFGVRRHWPVVRR
jgi:hypothetical protein